MTMLSSLVTSAANPTSDRRRARLFGRRLVALVAMGTASLSLGACGGSNSGGASETTTASASTYKVVSDADVTSGLTKVSAIMATLESRRVADETDARTGLDEMYNAWFEIEGTVRKNEKDMYLQMEDGLVSAKVGVQENRLPKIKSGITDFEGARALYLAKHP